MASDLGNGGARRTFERVRGALQADPRSVEAWCDLAEFYLNLDEPQQALEACRRALTLAPEHPRACLLLAAALLATGDAVGAEREARAALAVDAELAPAWRILGDALFAGGRAADAAKALRESLQRDPGNAESSHNLGLVLDDLRDLAAARVAFENALELAPELWAAASQLAHLQRRLCDWRGLEALNGRLRAAVRTGAQGIAPFAFLTESSDPAEQLACAKIHAQSVIAATEMLRRAMANAQPVARDAKLRVGFVSSGFNNHPTGLLTVELIERLRGSRLETHAFATTAGDGGALRQRLQNAFDRFHEVPGLSPLALAQRIDECDVDLLIDLRGYGAGSVAETLALRPAPVQINWLAYPGTSGAPFIDYLIADRYLVPDAQRAHYSEAVAYLPQCFQPSDSTRSVGQPASRQACGLPETGTVFASFNNSYKITPDVFAGWLRILAATPGSVLWLLDPGDGGIAARNLRAAAEAGGVGGHRLVFMDKQPHAQYLACYRHVDLFLDTWPYGAHTTANDALFAGCPVLALEGRSYAARVAGSLLTNLGLPELIAENPEDYVARAIALSQSPALRARLLERKRSAPLFDMDRFARDFERLLEQIWQRHRSGLPAMDLTIE